ncbi:MAG: hypothetical protein HQL69_13910 [Magnetococcales bacterium]|nr:hypothetical protein [Magnetococcales bacterium]
MNLVNKPNPMTAMTLLAWQDCVERLDTLLLEIRHLQVNLIYTLRTPTLYRALRFEEDHLWGGNWERGSGNPMDDSWLNSLIKADCSENDLASWWIIQFPLPSKFVEETLKNREAPKGVDEKVRQKIAEEMRKEAEIHWKTGYWDNDQKRHYRVLHNAQAIKSNILADKLYIFKWAASFFHINPHTGPDLDQLDPNDLARLMVLRAAILTRMQDIYLPRVEDVQAQVSRALESNWEEYSRPSLGRRRDQALYSEILSKRTKQAHTELNSLTDEFGVPCVDEDMDCINTFHRWEHDFTSHFGLFVDEVGLPFIKQGASLKSHSLFVNSSFWMLERPDLQPSIVHEVAHGILKMRFQDLSPWYLQGADDEFSRIIRLLHQCMEEFGLVRDSRTGQSTTHLPRYNLREIASDLLAATANGPSYLYALFLEILGLGLEDLFHVPPDRLDLTMMNHLDGSVGATSQNREWYFRLRLVSAWLQGLDGVSKFNGTSKASDVSALDVILYDGIDKLLDTMLDYLNDMAPPEYQNGPGWKHLTDMMCKVVVNSPAMDIGRNWRNKRRKFHQSHHSDQNGTFFKSESWSLPSVVREFLFNELVKIKEGLFNHELENITSPTIKQYKEAFNSRYPGVLSSSHSQDISILYQSYDIPWQCAILRAWDFLHPESSKRVPPKYWCYDMHYQMALGRELYQHAQEFYLLLGSQTDQPLGDAYRVLAQLIWRDKEEQLSKDQFAKDYHKPVLLGIEKWMNGSVEGSDIVDRLSRNGSNIILGNWEFIDFQPFYEGETISIERLLKALSKFDEKKYQNVMVDLSKLLSVEMLLSSKMLHRIPDLKFFPQQRFIHDLWHHKCRDLYSLIPSWIQGLQEGDKQLDIIDEKNKRSWLLEHKLVGLQKMLEFRLSAFDLYRSENGQQHQFFSSLCEAMSVGTPECGKENHNYSISNSGYSYRRSLFMLGRITLTGAYNPPARDEINLNSGISKQKSILSALTSHRKGGWNQLSPPEAIHHTFHYYQSVLGRFDIFSLNPTRIMCRCPLPMIHSNEVRSNQSLNEVVPSPENERFSSFFIRRQLSIPVRLTKKLPAFLAKISDQIPKDECHPILAFITVVLNSRNNRLLFVHRLIQAISKSRNSQQSKDNHIVIDQAGPLFREGDMAMLADGQEDLLIMLINSREENNVEGNSRNIGEIFLLHELIKKDMMVSDASLNFTHQGLESVVESYENNLQNRNDEPQYTVTCRIKLMENRNLSNLQDMFEKAVNKRFYTFLEGIPEKVKSGIQRKDVFNIIRNAGNMDYTIIFNYVQYAEMRKLARECKVETEFESVAKHMNDLLGISMVRRVVTNIGINNSSS